MDASSAPGGGSGVPAAPARPKKRTGTSKYDFIKVKVWLGEDLDHYYILSRFLICRMLTVTRIPYIKAVKIALETKKYLVDHNLHDVTQAKLEEVLFSIVRSKGFDEAYIDCYRMVTQFYQSRQPLVVIICGAAWTGKSTLAQQLASRINIPNVMQTDVIYELLRSGPDSPLHPVPLWARPGLAGGRCCDAALVREFRREARVVREGMEGDLIKTLSDGKPIIIEGSQLDPGLYIPDFGSRGLIMLPARPTAALTAAAAVAAGGGLHAAAAAGRSPGSSPLAGRGRYGRSQTLPRGAAAAVGGAGDASVKQLQEPVPQEQGDQAQRQPQQQQQQQQDVMSSCRRSMSAAAEVSVSAAGPLSPGSLTAAAGGSSVSAETALALLRQGAAADTPNGQQQQQQQQQDWQQQHQHPQRLLRVSEEPGQPQQQASSLPPLPLLRLRRQDVSTSQMNRHGPGNSPRSSSSSSSVQQSLFAPGAPSSVGVGSSSVHQQQPLGYRQRMGSPFADAAAAAGAAASATGSSSAAQAAAGGDGGSDSNWATDRLFSGQDELPVVMTGEEVQVCAAAAEAAALQQHRQEQQMHSQLQQQLAQQGRGGPLPGSPFSPDSDASSGGVGGGSPCCISQEHSTTEVVSRVCSCASLGSPALALSQEASGVDVWSPAAAGTAPAPAAAAAAAGADGPGCGAAMCRQLSSGGLRAGGLRVRGSAGNSSSRSLQQLPEEQEGCEVQQQQLQKANHTQQRQQEQQQNGLAPAGRPVACQLRPAAASSPPSLPGDSAGQAQPVPAAAAEAPSQPTSSTRLSADSCVVHDTAEAQQLQQQQQQQCEESSGAAKKAVAEPEPVGKPLFVPILLYMDEPDHVLMADEALAHLGLPPAAAAAAGQRAAGAAAGDSSAAKAAAVGGSDASCMHTEAPSGEGGAQGDGGAVQGAVAQQQQHHHQQQQQGGAESVGEALRRVRLLQEYLCAYEAQGLPVVKVSYGAFGEALDKLHEYVLQCIKVAMQSRAAGGGVT